MIATGTVCDHRACPALARVTVALAGGDLAFCNHHWRMHAEPLGLAAIANMVADVEAATVPAPAAA